MKSKTKRKTSVNNMNHAHTNNACHQIQTKWHPRTRICPISIMTSENGSTTEVKGRG
jgi:hypothetical protein